MIKIKNLRAKVEDKEVLKGLNLEVKAGEVHAIMGPNGSGKTTILEIISNFSNATLGDLIKINFKSLAFHFITLESKKYIIFLQKVNESKIILKLKFQKAH